MMGSAGCIFSTSVAYVCGKGTGKYSISHKLGLVDMVGGVSPSTMSREKATMCPLSTFFCVGEGRVFDSPEDL